MAKNLRVLAPEEWAMLEDSLRSMVDNPGYITEPSFCPRSSIYPTNLIPFVDKHLEYMRKHPTTDPYHYIANLKLMTKIH
jgi:hypothetical protein